MPFAIGDIIFGLRRLRHQTMRDAQAASDVRVL
jgi:hypothetical protein